PAPNLAPCLPAKWHRAGDTNPAAAAVRAGCRAWHPRRLSLHARLSRRAGPGRGTEQLLRDRYRVGWMQRRWRWGRWRLRRRLTSYRDQSASAAVCLRCVTR
ncbi:MAG: hypothetical protein ACK56I_14345, partial [bacterium]